MPGRAIPWCWPFGIRWHLHLVPVGMFVLWVVLLVTPAWLVL
jgi:hypothetical protein